MKHWFKGMACGLCMTLGAAQAQAQAQQALALGRLCGDQGNAQRISEHLVAPEVVHAVAAMRTVDVASLINDADKLRDAPEPDYVQSQLLLDVALDASLRADASSESLIADTMGRLGKILQWRSKLPDAKATYDCVLTIRRRSLGDRHPLTARALLDLAGYEAQFQRNDTRQQRDYLNQAIGILKPKGKETRGDLANALTSLANLERAEGRLSEAVSLYREALDNGQQDPMCGPTCISVAILQNNLGAALTEQHQYDQADALFKAALQMKLQRRGPAHDSTATTLQSMARLAAKRNDVAALDLYRQSSGILLVTTQKSTSNDAAVLSRLAEVSAEMGAYCEKLNSPEGRAEAMLQYTISVDARQKMRRNAAGLSEADRRAFDGAVKAPYYQLANILVDAGRLAEAERVINLLKEEEFADVVRGSHQPRNHSSQTGLSKMALDTQADMAARLVDEASELYTLEQRGWANLDDQQRQRYLALQLSMQQERDQFQRFLSDLGKKLAPQDTGVSTTLIKREATDLSKKVSLDPIGAVGLQYIVTDVRILIIVSTARGEPIGLHSEIPRRRLTALIAAFRQDIVNEANTKSRAQALWDVLIKPVQTHLRASKAKTLVLSLTESLRYLPFSALQDPKGRYLVEDYAIVNWAGASDIQPASANLPWWIVGMGLTEARGPGYSPLKWVEPELNAIVRTDLNQAGVVPGEIWLNNAFDKDRFEASLHGAANVIHIASHFNFQPGDEQQSILLLGKQGETLSLGEMAVKDFHKIQLLTLSACETAMGEGINQNGAQVEGLAAAILEAKAQAVLATLWKVNDPSTAEVMTRFYAAHQRDTSMTRARSLQLAQLAVLQGSEPLLKPPPEAARTTIAVARPSNAAPAGRWTHPRYWAPFVLSGNWL